MMKFYKVKSYLIILYWFKLLISNENDKRGHSFNDEQECKRILQEVMKKLDEAEKKWALNTDVSSLVEVTFTVADCILAIVLNRLQFIGHGDYMSPKARPELSTWWRRVKTPEFLISNTNESIISLYMIKAKSSVIRSVDYRIHNCHKNIFVFILPWSVYICKLKLNNNCE